MAKLHEVIAAEGNRNDSAQKVIADARDKFTKNTAFHGQIRTLKLLTEIPGKEAQEQAESQVAVVATSVAETLRFMLGMWANVEDVRATKNQTNTIAKADLIIGGTVIAQDVPVDELMGLEARMVELKKLFTQAPSIDARKEWSPSKRWPVYGLRETSPTQTVKTEKEVYGIPLAPATDKFPAQIKEATRTINIGVFTDQSFSSALTTDQKVELISRADEIIVACRQARNRANDVEAIQVKIGSAVASYLLGAVYDTLQA